MTTLFEQIQTACPYLPEEIQNDLENILSEKAMIPSETVADYVDILNVDIGSLMVQLLPLAAIYARAPISNYAVGAIALGMAPEDPMVQGPGHLYFGANMEFPHEALSFCVHAEQAAINHAWLNDEPGLQALAVSAAPCGYCRQFLNELNSIDKGFSIILKANQTPNDFSYSSNALSYYLPDAFGPYDLGKTGGLMDKENQGLSISSGVMSALAALDAANKSYSPYSQDFSGFVLRDNNKKIYAGRYAENAAYNPSMSPLESALANMNMNLPPQAELEISEAILVEAATVISQLNASKAVLSSIAPGLHLIHYTAIKEPVL